MYGGTKGEMERLIRDANRLKEANGEMADLSISSFANIVEAIHLVQVEMGITGTTAKEAASTIQGSTSSMSAAWSNLVTGIANDEADFGYLVSNFAGSVSTAADNIVPRIRIAVEGVSLLIDELLPTIADKVPQIISENLPTIVESGAKIVTSLVNGISDNKDDLIKPATDAMTKIGTTMIDLLPDVLSIGGDVITSLASGVSDSLPDLIPAAESAISKIVEELGDQESVEELAGAALDIITQLAAGLSDSLPELIPAAFDAILTFADELTSEDSILELSGGALDVIVALAAGLIEALPDLLERVPEIIGRLVSTLTSEENVEKMKNAGSELLAAFGEGFTDLFQAGYKKLVEVFPLIDDIGLGEKTFGQMVVDAFTGKGFEDENRYPTLGTGWGTTIGTSTGGKSGANIIINAPSIDQSTVDYLVRQVNSQLGVEAW